MKICTINFILPHKTQKSKKCTFLKNDSFEKINFKSNIPHEISKNIPNNFTIDKLISMAQTDKNLRGIGANSKVYNIPYLDNYVLKILNKDDPNGIKINEFPTTINLGQPIWQNEKNSRQLILKKVKGKEHSIPSWTHTIWDETIKKPHLVTKEQTQIYFKSVEKLAKMPQEAFDELAYKAKLLSDKEYKIDSINPNNLIVDENEIHIIDYFKVKPSELNVYQNCSYDLLAIMLDFTLLPEYIEKMSPEEQDKFLQNTKIIFEKVQKASKQADFSTDIETYKTYINETSKWFITTSAFESNGKEHIRLYDYRAQDFLKWLDKLSSS